MWAEDKELLGAIDALVNASQPECDQLMEILHDRKILDNPQMISIYALGVFANEYNVLRNTGYEKTETPSMEVLVELIVNSHLAVQKDEKLQNVAASLMVNKVDQAVEENVG